jgi:hypothetical protein
MKWSFETAQCEQKPTAWLSSCGDFLFWVTKNGSSISEFSKRTGGVCCRSKMPNQPLTPLYGEVSIKITP